MVMHVCEGRAHNPSVQKSLKHNISNCLEKEIVTRSCSLKFSVMLLKKSFKFLNFKSCVTALFHVLKVQPNLKSFSLEAQTKAGCSKC